MRIAQLTPLVVSLAIAAGICAGSNAEANLRGQMLTPQPVVLPKADQGLSPQDIVNLTERDGERIKIWVLFTDKGISTQAEFTAVASQVGMTERAMKRRAKVDRKEVVFADLPVRQDYIEAIETLGAEHRRTSRWLNGASFEINHAVLSLVESMSFVRQIRPLLIYRRPPTEAIPYKPGQAGDKALGQDVLNYGFAEEQLSQINVPAMHNQGLDGSGVTLAIFDTGFRKSHEAFAQHYLEGRVLAEYDFVFNDSNVANEPEDWSNAWNHGTYIWSTAGGFVDGTLYGPAYRANFILCKTEDVRSETQVEEDNWVAALEWVDSLGADVVTSSLSYHDFDDGSGYDFEDLDGWTGVSSIAASMAAGMGIVVCNSAGNSGPTPSTCYPPADAHDIVAVGAVDNNGVLAGFSSRGPTYDGRIKPEVVARGVSTACATSSSDDSYGSASGTSLSTPLVAGVVCLLIQANPGFTPEMIRQSLMETADNSAAPDNNYGWGLIDAMAAVGWGADFAADTTFGEPPLTVSFYDNSSLAASAWTWDFGDGDSAWVQSPSHTYSEVGVFDVSLTIDTDFGDITKTKPGYIMLFGDTAIFELDSVWPGQEVALSVDLINSQPAERIVVPIRFEDEPVIEFDSATVGSRTSYFERFRIVVYDPANNRYGWELVADIGGGSPPLPAGAGEVLKLWFTVAPGATEGALNTIDSASGSTLLEITSPYATYQLPSIAGGVYVRISQRGDVNGDGAIDISDLVYLAAYMFQFGPAPVTPKASDVDNDGGTNISDLIYLVDYMFNNGPPPPTS